MTSPKKSADGTQLRESFTVQPKAKRPPVSVLGVQGDESAMTAAPAPVPASILDENPEKVLSTLADSDSRYVRIPVEQLPSKGAFYDYTALSVRKFPFPAFKKIARAQATSSFRTLVEVVNESIDRDLFSMTTGDFWFLMYWHRINSYLTAPLDITFHCSNPAHIAATQLPPDDEMYQDPKTLEGLVTLQKSNLQVEFIPDEEKLAACIAHMYNTYGILPDPPRVKDLIENVEMMDRLSGLEAFKAEMKANGDESAASVAVSVGDKVLESAEEEWLNDNASLLSDFHGVTLEAKRTWLLAHTEERDIGYELQQEFDTFQGLVAHGIRESVRTTCRGCGGSAEGIISANALRFFPSLL